MLETKVTSLHFTLRYLLLFRRTVIFPVVTLFIHRIAVLFIPYPFLVPRACPNVVVLPPDLMVGDRRGLSDLLGDLLGRDKSGAGASNAGGCVRIWAYEKAVNESQGATMKTMANEKERQEVTGRREGERISAYIHPM
ncbi:hypothetical protein BS47DRAFT_403394 [Hydnum rufescens UP504]|uniref:Uncharacterized protein n=1 Tax=Hydnum rufescens UP504 TaxID=1448309 RepID=A0A9P6BBG1_9AGAM|nr:hypothetical protein BS47DRAFT_403394 [Hydnum rufescens UP504]